MPMDAFVSAPALFFPSFLIVPQYQIKPPIKAVELIPPVQTVILRGRLLSLLGFEVPSFDVGSLPQRKVQNPNCVLCSIELVVPFESHLDLPSPLPPPDL